MLTLTYWVSKAAAPRWPLTPTEQVPGEALLGHRAGQVEPDVVVEIRDRVGEHLLAAAGDVFASASSCVGPQRIQGSAEVGDRAVGGRRRATARPTASAASTPRCRRERRSRWS